MRNAKHILAMAALVFFTLYGCAPKGPILVGMGYLAPPQAVAGKTTKVVGISPILDSRGTPDSAVGRKSQASDGRESELVVQGTVAGIVTASFREALEKRGFIVKEVRSWDLSGGPVAVEGIDLLIGGEIRALWVDVVSRTVRDLYTVDVQIRASLVDVAGRGTHNLNLNCKLEREDIKFSVERVEKLLSEALSTAVDQLINSEGFQKSCL